VVADALMGIDNVLGVAGAASGSFELVALGLMISIPIVVFGSQVVLKMVERWPLIIPLGGVVLAFTAAQMVVKEPLLDDLFDGATWVHDLARWSVHVAFIAAIVVLSWWQHKRQNNTHSDQQLEMV